MLSYEDFVDAASQIQSREELGRLLVKDAQSAGFDNINFATLKDRQVLALPWLSLPDGFGDFYILQDFKSIDPVLAFAEKFQGHFFWEEATRRMTLTATEMEMMHHCQDFHVHSGSTYVVHKPGGVIDIVGFSKRHYDKTDPESIPILREKAAFAHRRFDELGCSDTSAPLGHALSQYLHHHGPPGMTLARCKALVFVDMAATRWRLGLPELNIKLRDFVAQDDLNYLMRWGLIHEVPDESHFYYILVPTVLGKNHIRLCAHVPELRRSLWEAEVTSGRLPPLE